MKRKIRFILIAALAVIGCIVGIFIVLDFFLTGIEVRITNNGPHAVTDLSLYYTGGVREARELGSRATRRFKIKSRSESALDVEFFDNTGKRHKHSVDVYLEPSDSGHIDIVIGDDYQIKWSMESKSFWYSPSPPITDSGP
jgi:hypothetical protein